MTAKPFVRWAGGKRRLLPDILFRLPEDFGERTLIDPFVGGGAVFFGVDATKKAYLSDSNARLMSTYRAVRDKPISVTGLAQEYARKHSKESYYAIRAEFNSLPEDAYVAAAAMMLYLNRACFNALYRENGRGEFNVPIGDKESIEIDYQEIEDASHRLRGASIRCEDFRATPITKDGFYYLDPPYIGHFVQYTSRGFSWEDHYDLLCLCNDINRAGGKFLMSNSDCDDTKLMFKHYRMETIRTHRRINHSESTELLIRNY